MLSRNNFTLWKSPRLLPHVTMKVYPSLSAGYKQKENIAVAKKKKIAFFLFKQNGGTVHNKQFAIVVAVAVVPVCPSVYSLKRQCQHGDSLQDQRGRRGRSGQRCSSGTFSVWGGNRSEIKIQKARNEVGGLQRVQTVCMPNANSKIFEI